MTQTLDNGIVVPVNSDAYNLTPDLAVMGKSASVITVVNSQAQRDALDLTKPRVVARADLGMILEAWDGSVWWRGGGSSTPVATVTGNAGWGLTGSLIRHKGTAGTQVNAAFMCTYGSAAGAFTINTGFIRALTLNNPGFIPTADAFGYTVVLSSTNVVRADCAFNVNPSGEIWIRMFSGSYSVQPTDKFYISANWNA